MLLFSATQILLSLPRPLELLDRVPELGTLGNESASVGAIRAPDGRLQELHLSLWREWN
jgi:hypothetical protein